MTSDSISLIANVSIALSFLVAVIFGLAQVKAAARDRHERLTLDTLRGFQTRQFAELIHYVTTHDLPLSQADFRTRPADEQVIFIHLAQEMESLGILVYERLIDLDLVDKTLGSFVTVAWERYKTMFLDMRVTVPDPFLGEYFQWLAEQIDARMRENPRPPVHESSGGVAHKRRGLRFFRH